MPHNKHKLYMTISVSLLLSICGPPAALLEVTDLWGNWSSSIPCVLFRGWIEGSSSLGDILPAITEA